MLLARIIARMMIMEETEPIALAIGQMRKLLTNADVQREGCYALAFKAIDLGRSVISVGGHLAVLDAMNRHGQNERLQFDGCEMLWRLSMDEDNAQVVLDAGALQAVFAAISLHPESVRVQEEAVGALRWFAQRDAKRVVDAGGLDVVIRVMENLAEFSWVQMWCCGALGSIAQLEASNVQDMRGFQMIRDAMQKHHDCPEVQRLGFEALKFDPAIRKTLGRS
jgi:hypothetical protein